MKKIGLAVCHDSKNFGSQLQLLANIKKIEELGYETEIIRYKKVITPTFVVQTIPRLFNFTFVRTKLSHKLKARNIRKYPTVARNVSVRNARFHQFAKQHFPNMSNPYRGWETLVREAPKNYDAFLCGSDQLWLPINLGSHFYTLEFAPDDKPKIAYATSFGVSVIPDFQKKRTARYLNRFQRLSTREIAGSKIIESLTGKKPSVVCDPTLLFDSAEWLEMIPDATVVEGDYIFCYILGNNLEHRRICEQLKEKTGLPLVTSPFMNHFVESDQTFGDIQLYDLDAADFVNLIRHAKYILTDSFHGSVFSILHHKQFLTFNRFGDDPNSRNSRIDSLCTLLGLNERRYAGDVQAIDREIDYARVDDALLSFRRESIAYLKDALALTEKGK